MDTKSFGGMASARQADGSLPVLPLLHLAPGSMLIDRGVDVGAAFVGKAPDLGAFESGADEHMPGGVAGSGGSGGSSQTVPGASAGAGGAGAPAGAGHAAPGAAAGGGSVPTPAAAPSASQAGCNCQIDRARPSRGTPLALLGLVGLSLLRLRRTRRDARS
jgi:MYXO-CTERM domain-containing protein